MGIGGLSFDVAVRRLEGKQSTLAYSFLALILQHRAHFPFNRSTLDRDTASENTATATADIGRHSFDAAVWKLEAEYRRFGAGVWCLIFEYRAHLNLRLTHCRARYGHGGHGHVDRHSFSTAVGNWKGEIDVLAPFYFEILGKKKD